MEPRVTPGNLLLIGINIIVFIMLSFMGSTESVDFLLQYGAMEWRAVLEGGEYYRIFSSMFLHFGFEHLFANMLFLSLIGCYLEDALGSIKYILFYLMAGIGSGICSLITDAYLQVNVVSAGASGAIFGVVGGLLCVVIRNKGSYEGIGIGGLILMIAGTLYYGFTSTDVDNVAHVGGFIIGFFLCFLFYNKKKDTRRRAERRMEERRRRNPDQGSFY